MKIALDIGHTSGRDQGAVSSCGLTEHMYWKSHIHIIKDILEQHGFQANIYRREDHSGSVSAECRAINTWGANAAISLHLNSSDNTKATGHEVIYHGGSRNGAALARSINDQLNFISELRDRNIRTPFSGRGNTWLTATKCPAVIVEAGFLSNPDDVKILKERGSEIASLIATGIINFLEKGNTPINLN